MKTRMCVTRFGLTKKQWERFDNFFKNNPKGILTKEIIGKRKRKEGRQGHAVVLVEIFKDHLYFLNSYGKEWGDNGFFRVKDAKVLGAKFLEIYIEPHKYTAEEKDKYNKFNKNIKNNLSKYLFEDEEFYF